MPLISIIAPVCTAAYCLPATLAKAGARTLSDGERIPFLILAPLLVVPIAWTRRLAKREYAANPATEAPALEESK